MHVTIVPVDDVWMRIDCDDSIAREISDHFTFDIPNAKFMPQFRNRNWSGKIRLFKLRDRLLYRGLLTRVLEFATQQGYDVDNRVPNPTPLLPELTDWIAAQPLPVEPRDYQIAAIRSLLDRHRGIILSPTGSGKSLIIYLLIRALNVPTLIVVPTTGLVTQLSDDMVTYGADSSQIQSIRGGLTKTQQAQIVVSTWQSIYQMPTSYFDAFSCVIVDEVHLAKAKSLTGLLEKCRHIPYRFGCTGTLDDTQAHRLILEGLFGDVTRVMTTKQLIENKQLAPLKVKLCVLKYPETVCRDMKRALYQDEIEFLVTHPVRLEIVSRMVAQASGNVLVLFNYVDKHGKPLYERIRTLAPTRDVHFVSGDIAAEEREHIRQWVTNGTQQIIVASYGTTSTGINIPNINVIVFASPSKSKIRVLQSIGRGLRMHEQKTHTTLIDIADDLRIGASVNHTYRHAEERVKYYAQEKFAYTIHELTLDRL